MTVQEYTDHLLEAATAQGLSADNDVFFSPQKGNIIAITYKEPDRVLPLNCLWIDADPSSATYKRMRQRFAKTPNQGFKNSWRVVTEMDQVNSPQFWDTEDLPPPVIISGKGGTLEGPIFTEETKEQFDLYEYINRKYMDAKQKSLSNGFFVTLNGLNGRVSQNTQRIVELEKKLGPVESHNLTFVQEDKSNEWALQHNLGAGTGVVICVNEEGQYIWPEKVVRSADPNTLLVSFLQPVSGIAVLTYIKK